MTQETYIREIQRKTGFSRATNKRVGADLAGDIAARQEAGEALPDILQDMGTPEEMAASLRDLRESMPGQVLPKKSAWRWVFLALAVAMAGCLVYLAVWHSLYAPWVSNVPDQVFFVLLGNDDGAKVAMTPGVIDIRQVSYGVRVGFGEVVGLGLGALGMFFLLEWTGRGRRRHLALAAGLFVLAVVLLAGGLSGSFLEAFVVQKSLAALLLSRVLNPAFLLPAVCGILALRAGLRKPAVTKVQAE